MISDKERAKNARFNNSPKGRWRAYKYAARTRGIRFGLSFMEFMAFWGRPCFYCAYPIVTIGLDRINNRKGYAPGNVRACCMYCNRSKADLTEARFFDHCLRVCITRMLRMRALRRTKMAFFSGGRASAPRTPRPRRA